MRELIASCLVILFAPVFSVLANTVAIIDSGVDYLHKDLENQMWNNPNEIPGNRRDDDGNLFRDDVYGWNFAGGNNEVINYNYLGKFTDDPYKYLEIQGRYIKGEASLEEIEWMKAKREEKAFIKEMGIFGNFAHGTHVARITSRLSPNSKVMAIKLLPTEANEAKSWLKGIANDSYKLHKVFNNDSIAMKSGGGGKKGKGKNQEALLKKALEALAGAQVDLLATSFRYASEQGAGVVNGSFGTSFNMIKMLTDNAFRIIYLRKPNEAESEKTARLYFKANIDALTIEIAKYPSTLFVFAAGNDGANNDLFPSSPANVKLPNVLTVAATVGDKSLASFSNYGMKIVDVGAPGVAILSAVPSESHKDQVYMSGTSQASPYVAGVASRVRVLNRALSAEQSRKIVLETADKKDFLFRKVASSGLVNAERAAFAATQSTKMDLDAAIALSKKTILEKKEAKETEILAVNTTGLMFNQNSSLGNLEEHQEALTISADKFVEKIKLIQE